MEFTSSLATDVKEDSKLSILSIACRQNAKAKTTTLTKDFKLTQLSGNSV